MNEEISNIVDLGMKVLVKTPDEPWRYENGKLHDCAYQVGCTVYGYYTLDIGSYDQSVYCTINLKDRTMSLQTVKDSPLYYRTHVLDIVNGEARYYNRYPIAPTW